MFVCNPGIPSRVDNRRWLYVMSPHRGVKRESVTNELSKKISKYASSESLQDSFNRAPKHTSTQLSQEAINEVFLDASQETVNKANQDHSSQYSQETINKIFEETSSQFSQDTISEAPQDVSSQYSQETISKIFEDPSFETFEETSSSTLRDSEDVTSTQSTKRMRNSAEVTLLSPKDASLQISQDTLSKIFDDDSFEPSDNLKISSANRLEACNTNPDESLSKLFDGSFEPSGNTKTSSVNCIEACNTNPDESVSKLFDGSFEPSNNSTKSSIDNLVVCSTNDEDSMDSDEAWYESSVPRIKWKTSSTVGKWLLFNDTEIDPIDKLSAHDRAWEKIKSIVTNPSNVDIFSAKCSTNYSFRYSEYASSTGVTCCYTGDYRDKMSVKRAADAIRNALWFTCCIYYKTDDATSAGAYQHLGNTAISMYMHTNGNKMYERDEHGKWTLARF